MRKNKHLNKPDLMKRQKYVDQACGASISSHHARKHSFDTMSLLYGSTIGSYFMSDDSCLSSVKSAVDHDLPRISSAAMENHALLRCISASSMGCFSLFSKLGSQSSFPSQTKPLPTSGDTTQSKDSVLDALLDDACIIDFEQSPSCDSRVLLREILTSMDRSSSQSPSPPPNAEPVADGGPPPGDGVEPIADNMKCRKSRERLCHPSQRRVPPSLVTPKYQLPKDEQGSYLWPWEWFE